MKTTDLIPIILYQLIDGDRYGYEIVKQVEDVSSGNIVIKQPTLYSVLKKLEQGRFITSYWQDSEIGGKRHYYKLTDNGRAQLSTYPPLQSLVNDVLVEDGIVPTPATTTTKVETVNQTYIQEKSDIQPQPVIKDNDKTEVITADNNEIKPITIDLSSPTGFKSDTSDYILPQQEVVEIDLSTSNEENQPIKNEQTSTTSASSSISIFDAIEPETTHSPTKSSIFEAIKSESDNKPGNIFNCLEVDDTDNESIEPIIDEPPVNIVEKSMQEVPAEPVKQQDSTIYPTTIEIEKVPFLNYVDFSTDEETIKRKQSITKHVQKMIFTTTSLLLLLILSIVVCSKYSFSKLYYISAVIAVILIVAYPISLLTKLSKIRLKYCTHPFKYSLSRDFFIKLSLFLSLIIVVFAYNLSSASTIGQIFKLSNFASFVAPIMLGSIIMLDFGFSAILYKQYYDNK